MKRMAVLCLFVGFAGSPLVTLAETENWTKPQQEIADVFKAWAEAEKSGDVEREMSLTAPAFTGWDFTTSHPLDRAAYRQLSAGLFKLCKVVDCSIPATFIHIEGNCAVAHGRYMETTQDASGRRATTQGPWTASLVRDGRKWLVLALSYTQDQRVVNEAAVKQEVEQTMQALLQAFDRADIDGILRHFADDPAFLAVDPEGKISDSPAFRKATREFFQNVSGETNHTSRQDLRVLNADTVIVAWEGTCQTQLKDGTALNYESYGATFVFRRIGQEWKIIYDHESGPAPQPVKPAPPSGASTELKMP